MKIVKPQYPLVLGLAAALVGPSFAQAPREIPPVTQQQGIEATPLGQVSRPPDPQDETTGQAERSQFQAPTFNQGPDACWISKEDDRYQGGYWGPCSEHQERSIK